MGNLSETWTKKIPNGNTKMKNKISGKKNLTDWLKNRLTVKKGGTSEWIDEFIKVSKLKQK